MGSQNIGLKELTGKILQTKALRAEEPNRALQRRDVLGENIDISILAG